MHTGDEKRRSRVMLVVASGLLALGLTGCEQRLKTASDEAKACAQMRPIIAVFNMRDIAAPVDGGNAADGATPNSDIALLLRVKSALDSEPGLVRFPIDVGARRGVITLYGEVDTAQRRARAMQIAQNVRGVQAVKSGIAVIRRL